jgi:hypothetical protein
LQSRNQEFLTRIARILPIEFALKRSEYGDGKRSGEKAVEGRRSPRRWREFQWHTNFAERLGLRQPSGALDGRFPGQLWLAKLLDEAQSRKHEAARFQSEDRCTDLVRGIAGYCLADDSRGNICPQSS